MYANTDLDEMEARLVAKLRRKLNIKTKTLQAGMKRAGRLLPKEAHRAARDVMDAKRNLSHPKLARMVDMASLARAEKAIDFHLDKIDQTERRKDWWLSFASMQAMNLFWILALVIGLLLWRGLL